MKISLELLSILAFGVQIMFAVVSIMMTLLFMFQSLESVLRLK